MASTKEVIRDWEELEAEFEKVEEKHEKYLEKLQELSQLQQECAKAVKHHQYRSAQMRDAVKEMVKGPGALPLGEDEGRIKDIQTEIDDVRVRLTDLQQQLPVENNGLYLSIILGSSINLSLINKNDRYKYKEDYEKFKRNVTYVIIVVLVLAYMIQTRAMDSVVHFLMVWYYCTLTIRESILRINGSRIKGWWVAHHYASTVLAGITLTWEDGACYQLFRHQFLFFSFYISCVQLMQVYYQRGCLRRLYSLGQRHSMDITVEGFSSWMFKGLTFILPSLIIGYLFQFYNAITLVQIWRTHGCSGEWQVIALSLLFLLIAIGNSTTTMQVILRKFQERSLSKTRRRLETKYSISGGDVKIPLKTE